MEVFADIIRCSTWISLSSSVIIFNKWILSSAGFSKFTKQFKTLFLVTSCLLLP